MSFVKKLMVGGIGKRLVDKYLSKTDLTCETIDIVEGDDENFKDNLLGLNCKMKVAGFEFDFDEIKTRTNISKSHL